MTQQNKQEFLQEVMRYPNAVQPADRCSLAKSKLMTGRNNTE